jgi:hypothetical protein
MPVNLKDLNAKLCKSADDLRAFIESKLDLMLRQNVTCIDFAQRYQRIVDQYNSGGSATENYFEDMLKFAKDLTVEDERHIREGLTIEHALDLTLPPTYDRLAFQQARVRGTISSLNEPVKA